MFPFVPGFASSLFDLLFFICTSRLFEEDAEFENLFRERKVHSAVKPAPPRSHLRSLFHFVPSRSLLPKPCFQKSRGRKSLSPALSRGAGAQGAKSFFGGARSPVSQFRWEKLESKHKWAGFRVPVFYPQLTVTKRMASTKTKHTEKTRLQRSLLAKHMNSKR